MREARGTSAPAATWPEAEGAPSGPGRGARGGRGAGRPTLLRGLGPLRGCPQGSAGAHLFVGSRGADVLDPVPRCEAGAHRLGAAEAGVSGAK